MRANNCNDPHKNSYLLYFLVFLLNFLVSCQLANCLTIKNLIQVYLITYWCNFTKIIVKIHISAYLSIPFLYISMSDLTTKIRTWNTLQMAEYMTNDPKKISEYVLFLCKQHSLNNSWKIFILWLSKKHFLGHLLWWTGSVKFVGEYWPIFNSTVSV